MFSLRWFSCRRVHQCEAWHHTGRTRKWWWISHLGVGQQHLKGYGKFMWCDIVTRSLWVTELLQLKSVLKKKKKKGCLCLFEHIFEHFYLQGPAGGSHPNLSQPHWRLVLDSPGWSVDTLCPCWWVWDYGTQKCNWLPTRPQGPRVQCSE